MVTESAESAMKRSIVRVDGRGRLDHRSLTLELGTSPQASGSARLRLGRFWGLHQAGSWAFTDITLGATAHG